MSRVWLHSLHCNIYFLLSSTTSGYFIKQLQRLNSYGIPVRSLLMRAFRYVRRISIIVIIIIVSRLTWMSSSLTEWAWQLFRPKHITRLLKMAPKQILSNIYCSLPVRTRSRWHLKYGRANNVMWFATTVSYTLCLRTGDFVLHWICQTVTGLLK